MKDIIYFEDIQEPQFGGITKIFVKKSLDNRI